MRALLATILLFVAACVLEAAESSISDADHILKPLVGSTVVAEGLAWGSGNKGLGERLTLPYGQTIFLVGSEYKKKHQNGRLVRVVGKLTIQHMKAAPEGAQGYGADFDYYEISVTEFRVIEKVSHAFPQSKK